jgi:tRNA threonylcarbamoyladenosine biosynthesis protein TsaB
MMTFLFIEAKVALPLFLPPMATTILHIDTSGATAVVMLARDAVVLGHRASETERDHAGKINLLVDELLAAADVTLDGLDAIAVCNGPGSYTGLRIGLATAKGYCFALDKKLILHNRLNLMLLELEQELTYGAVNKVALLPARAGEYYWAAQLGQELVAPQHITTDLLLSKTAENGAGVALIGQPGPDLVHLSIIHNLAYNTLNLNCWASVTYQAFLSGDLADIAYAEPEYLKSAYITASRTDR